MKSLGFHFILILIILNFPTKILSQGNIGINNDASNPDASAMLDVKSTTKGILIPRMTNAERNAIANPATGLMVFNSSENCFNFFNGTNWIKIVAGQDDDRTISGSDMFNNNPGNIGIGTSIPERRFTINGDSTDIRLNLNQETGKNSQSIQFAVNGIEYSYLQFEKSTKNIVLEIDKNHLDQGAILFKRKGDDMLAFKPNKDIVFKNSGDDRFIISNNGDIQFKKHGDDRLAIIGPVGNVGIGTSTPWSRLTITGDSTNIALNLNSSSANNRQELKFMVDRIARSMIQFDKTNNNLTFEVDQNNQGTGDIVFKKHGDDRLAIIGPTGNVGIGTATPDSRLTITGNATDVKLDINQASGNPIQGLIFAVDHLERGSFTFEKSTNNLVIDADKNNLGIGDILLKKHGDDRLAIRNNGDVQFKRYGDDRLAIRGDNGNVGIGTMTPANKLTIKGSATDIGMDLDLASPASSQGIKFAVEALEKSTITHEKLSNNLVIEVDKNGEDSGDIVFKKHGDDRLAIRNNGDVQFKRYGDDRLAIRGDNGNVGIGTSNPVSKLEVNGSVKVGNDPNPPSTLNAGSIRYRTEANSSFCEMVMQTGPSTFAWVVIKQFTW